MTHHDTSAHDEDQPSEKTATGGTGVPTGAPDQGGSGQTSEPPLDQTGTTSTGGGAAEAEATPWTDGQDPRDALRTAEDPDGTMTKPR